MSWNRIHVARNADPSESSQRQNLTGMVVPRGTDRTESRVMIF